MNDTVTSLYARFFGPFGPIITLDTGRKVRLGRQIAQGGFSFVFEATEVVDIGRSNTTNTTTTTTTSATMYALKRIQCPDAETIQACRREAAVHRSIGTCTQQQQQQQQHYHHPNVLPLLGFAVCGSDCYMLFPYVPHSLRAEVNRRLWESRDIIYNRRPPWDQLHVLQLFLGICHGVQALHEAGYSHRDVKLENVLLATDSSSSQSPPSSSSPLQLQVQSFRPVLMDFGSAGPLRQDLGTRRQVLQVMDSAAQHTTMSYRPPELFEGGIRTGDPSLDYTKVDVWSLGCTLFAMLYGASPLESEFYNITTTSSGHGHSHSSRPLGPLKIVDCTHLKVLATLPPRPPAHSPVAEWYDPAVLTLLGELLTHDRQRRPTLPAVMERATGLITQWGGRVDLHPYHHHHHASAPTSGGTASVYGDIDHHSDDGIALLSANRLV